LTGDLELYGNLRWLTVVGMTARELTVFKVHADDAELLVVSVLLNRLVSVRRLFQTLPRVSSADVPRSPAHTHTHTHTVPSVDNSLPRTAAPVGGSKDVNRFHRISD